MNHRMPGLEACLPPGVAPPSPPFLYKASRAPTHWEKPGSVYPGVLAHSVDHILRLVSITLRPAAAAAKSRQSCSTVSNPIDGSLPGFAVLGLAELNWVSVKQGVPTPKGKSGGPGPHS